MRDELASRLRLGSRSSVSLGVSLGLWACLDVESRLRPAADQQEMLHRWVVRWARQVLGVLSVDLRSTGPHLGDGRPYPASSAEGRGRIFVMNHRSAIDIVVTFASAEARLVSRHDLAGWPIMGRIARRLGTVFVDRDSLSSGAAALKVMTRALKRGQGVALYPEGTAFSGDEVRPFHPGAFRVAQRTGAEVVPLGIAYADEAAYYGDESFGEHMTRVLSLPKLRVALAAGEPISPAGASHEELRERCRERVQDLVGQARALL